MTTEWSPSRLQRLLECGEAYRREYLVGDGERLNSASTLMGRSFHRAAQLAAEAAAAEQEISQAFALDNAKLFFEMQVEEDQATPNPIPWSEDALDARHENLRRMTMLLLKRLPQVWAAYGRPTLSEWEFRRLPWRNHLLRGYLDLATDRHVLIDWKTGRRQFDREKARTSVQRLLYSAAYQEAYGVFPDLFVFVQVTRPRKADGPYRFYRQAVYQRVEELDLLDVMLTRAELIEASGAFQYNPQGWLCHPDRCQFYDSCPASLIAAEAAEEEEDDGADTSATGGPGRLEGETGGDPRPGDAAVGA